MESNSNNNNDEEGRQVRRTARKREFTELTNDGQPTAEEEQTPQPTVGSFSKNKREEGKDNLENLYVESLSREDLIQFAKKQLLEKNEAQKKLETTKMAADESAHQTKELSQRIVLLDQERAKVNEDLAKKMAEIVELHKKVEEKSKMVAETEEQCNALLIQLTESRQDPVGLPMPSNQMKIQLPLENWFDSLAFVPRHQLGKFVPKIGDRNFAFILQKFLHEYSQISLDMIDIVPPYDEHPSGKCPRVRVWQKNRRLRLKMADSQMPANIKNFDMLSLSYFDPSVCNFIQKFQQNGLLDSVTLSISKLSKDIVQPVLTNLLPILNDILKVEVCESSQLVDIYDDVGNNHEVVELYMKMMEKTRFLEASYDPTNLQPDKIDLCCRWLYQTPRADEKPRVLLFGRTQSDSAPISFFLDRIKQDFLMATDPIPFIIRINLPEATFQPEEEHIFIRQNDNTKEKLVTKMEKAPAPDEDEWQEVVLLISRYPLGSTKAWIDENEKVKEVLDSDLSRMSRTILLEEEMKIVM